MPVRRGKRRVGWIVVGAVLSVVGLGGTIVAGAVLVVSRGVASIDEIAEAQTPGTLRYDADEREYEVLLVRRRGDDSLRAEWVDCTITLADGTTVLLDGDAGATTSQIANTEAMGTFDAVPGTTTVTCTSEDDMRIHFVVREPSEIERVASILLFVMIGVLLVGVGALLAGIFWRRPSRA